MPDATEHVTTIQPATGSDGKTWYRPTCSCGHSGNGVWDTREGAERSGQRHIDSFKPHKPGRYEMRYEDGFITLRCNDCQETVDGWQGSTDYAVNDEKTAENVRAHEQERHGDA